MAGIVFVLILPCSSAATFWFYSPGAIVGPLGAFLPRSELDSESFVTREALRKGSSISTGPSLLFLGPSTIAQAFSDGDALTEAIANETGTIWELGMLTTPLQSPLDQLALIEASLRSRKVDDFPLVIAVGMGIQRLGWTKERLLKYQVQGRIGLRSDWVDAEMRRMGAVPRTKTGIYSIDNYRFVISHGAKPMIRLALLSPAVRKFDGYSKDLPMAEEARPRTAVAAQIRAGQKNREPYFALHERMAERISAYPGVHLLFVEEGLSPDFVRAASLVELEREASLEFPNFSEKVGAEFWPVFKEANLSGADFYDDLHVLRGSPQEKVQTAFVKRFALYAKLLGQVN